MKTKEYRAQVRCSGVKKRCRKAEAHNFFMGYYKLNHDVNDLLSMAGQIAQNKMKTINKAFLSLDLVELEQSETMGQIVHWSPFDEETKRLSKNYDITLTMGE
jgi:hypothetical protein